MILNFDEICNGCAFYCMVGFFAGQRPLMESEEHSNIRYKELYWKGISKVIADILNPNNNIKICFEEVYSLVYKCVCDGFSENLRMDLLEKCITHLHEVNQQLDSAVVMYDGPKKVFNT